MESDLPKILLAIGFTEIVVVVLWYKVGYNLRIDSDTQRYFYSSLIQAFATLAGLLLTILVFVYQRVKDSQSSFMDDAYKDALSLTVVLPADYDGARSSLYDWFRSELRERTNSMSIRTSTVKSRFADPRAADRGDPDISELTREYSFLRTNVRQYRQVVSHLGRFHDVGEFYDKTMSVMSILAVGFSFFVMILSVALLVLVDHLGVMHAFFTLTAAVLSGIGILYAGSFFRGMLRMFYGLNKLPGFVETELDEPVDAEAALAEARKMMGWQS